MSFNIGRPSSGGKKAAYQRFHANNPGYVAEWRRKKRDKSGAPIRTVGRPKKQRPNFMATVKAQDKTLIAKSVGRFVNSKMILDLLETLPKKVSSTSSLYAIFHWLAINAGR